MANPSVAKQTIVANGKKTNDRMQVSPAAHDVLAKIMALAQCNYIDTKSHQLTIMGLAMSKAVNQFKFHSIAEYLWVFCEILKSSGFQVEGFHPSFDLAKNLTTPESKYIWLLSRVACILPVSTTVSFSIYI